MRHLWIVVLAFLSTGFPVAAFARTGIEITPFAGFRFGGGFEDSSSGTNIDLDDSEDFGLILDFDLSRDRQIEIYLSRQGTELSADGPFTGDPLFDLTVEYYHVGGLYLFEVENERLRPFVSGTMGITRMDPHGGDLNTETRFSLALGGGAKLFLTDHFGLRFDVRGIYTAMDANGGVFCSGGCTIAVSSGGFIQGEVGAGFVLRL